MFDGLTRRFIFLVTVCVCFLLFGWGNWSSERAWSRSLSLRNNANLEPANSTLGFGAVVAVSKAGSPRRDALLYAANLTSIDITIPKQPSWTDHDVTAFKANEGSKISRGSALAWMGHLNALRWFLEETSLHTVLILEDDVDWDINLRRSQVPAAAQALRQLTNETSTHQYHTSDEAYWGDLNKWEIMYLGHCGDFFPTDDLSKNVHTSYFDSTLLPFAKMHTKTAALLRLLGVPEQTRLLHRSVWPLCTFGYAVTRKSAQRLLNDFSHEAKEGDKGGCDAFDVRILEACRDHNTEKGYVCYSVNPELMHHIEAPSEIANVNEGIDDSGRLQKQGTGSHTPNIGCGARSATFVSEDDNVREWVKAQVKQGKCLRDEAAEDMAKWP